MLILPLVENDNGSTSQHCDLCKELCPSSEIRGHLESQHKVQDFIVQCPIPSCPYVFSCRGKLEKHLTVRVGQSSKCCLKARLPSMLPPITCPVCGFQTKLKMEFRQHLMTHGGDNEKNISCPISPCKRKFAFQQSLDDHLYEHDYEDELRRKSGLKPADTPILQNCDLCGVSTSVTEIMSHLEDVHHVKEYITRCPNPSCPKVFSCHRKMENHLGITQTVYEANPCRIGAQLPATRPGKKCDTCGVEVFRPRFLNHLQRHEFQAGEKSLLCPIPGCPEKYALRQSVEEHLLVHDFRPPKQADQECSVCKEMIPVDKIESHLKEAHEVVEVIPCRRCPYRFHDWEPLLDHLSEHRLRTPWQSGGGPYSCELCSNDNEPAMKFLRYEQLRVHFFAVHQIGKKYLCESCDLEFFSRQGLSTHQKKRNGDKPTTSTKAASSNKKTYKCDLCPVVFGNQASLLSHNMREHGAPPSTCSFCSKPFTSYYSLVTHERTHKGLDRIFKCSVANCNRMFRCSSDLKHHERGGHRDASEPKLYMCDSCGKGFNTPFNLKLHMKNMHSDKKVSRPRRICETCGESFSTAQTLRGHTLRVHTGEGPAPRRPQLQCPIPGCGWASRVKRELQRHLKSHERKESGSDSAKPNGPTKRVRKRAVKNN